MGVFQQAGGAHGNGVMHDTQESHQVFEYSFGQLGFFKGLQDFFVRGITEGDGIEVVSFHELVEDIGTDDDRLGDVYGEVLAGQ
ncbi:hypothetical protein EVA_02073 [gut metagenome]|uniref:Uncharacterized protein n=1 Tax=gut metagenome TaxID=749906 RepID=J9GPW8_9ZZZZ